LFHRGEGSQNWLPRERPHKKSCTMTKQAASAERDDMVAEEENESKKDETKDSETSSSSSSSSSRKSGSRGGYSADCSASDDPSSDETRGSRTALGLSSLKLVESGADEAASSPSSSSGDEGETGKEDGKPEALHEEKHRNKETQKRKHGKASSSKIEAPSVANYQQIRSTRRPTYLDTMADSLLNNNKAAALSTDLTLNGQLPLPQWNGFVIRDLMDPRIDLSTVGTTVADVPAALQPLVSGQLKAPPEPSNENQEPIEAPEVPSVESYMHLMEVG